MIIVICLQVLRIAHMENLMVDVFKHFQMNVVPNILLLQAQDNSTGVSGDQHYSSENKVQTLDDLGEELVKSCEGLDVYQVSRNTVYVAMGIEK
jgi:hypothetical protein